MDEHADHALDLAEVVLIEVDRDGRPVELEKRPEAPGGHGAVDHALRLFVARVEEGRGVHLRDALREPLVVIDRKLQAREKPDPAVARSPYLYQDSDDWDLYRISTPLNVLRLVAGVAAVGVPASGCTRGRRVALALAGALAASIAVEVAPPSVVSG